MFAMKISSARVVVTCPGRNFVTLVIETDQGVTGIGDATLNGRELSVASYLADHVIPCIEGMDPRRSEDIWQYLYRGAYWRRGPVTMSAIAAVDTALWDIKAKLAGMSTVDAAMIWLGVVLSQPVVRTTPSSGYPLSSSTSPRYSRFRSSAAVGRRQFSKMG